MNTQLLNEIEQLPPEAQQQIADFVLFIKIRYLAEKHNMDFKTFLLNNPNIEEIDF